MTAGPYREGASLAICPRCGEPLDRAFDDVLACRRCQGLMITAPTAALAFGDPAWPKGASVVWWKSSLECPVCARDGVTTVMAAQTFEGTRIDRCATHGLWLDAGELSRLEQTTGDELAYLRGRLYGDGVEPGRLEAERERWRKDVEDRRRQEADQEARRVAERARQIEAIDRQHEQEQRAAEQERREAEAQRRAAEALRRKEAQTLFDAVPPQPAPIPPQPAPIPPRRSAEETWREREARRAQLEPRRVAIAAEIGELELQLIEARRSVRTLEGMLARERQRLRALLEELEG